MDNVQSKWVMASLNPTEAQREGRACIVCGSEKGRLIAVRRNGREVGNLVGHNVCPERYLKENDRRREAEREAHAARVERQAEEQIRKKRTSTRRRHESVEASPSVPLTTQSEILNPQAVDETRRRRYANVGRSKSPAKAAASRENGKRGGRPPKWNPQARALAAEGVRELARRFGRTDKKLQSQLLGLADVLEKGQLR